MNYEAAYKVAHKALDDIWKIVDPFATKDIDLAVRTTDIVDKVWKLREDHEKAKDVLRSAGFVRCDIPACNCGSWHQVGGFKARVLEIQEVVEEAGFSTNGRTLLDAVKDMANCADASVLRGAP